MCHSLSAKDRGHWKELVQDQRGGLSPRNQAKVPSTRELDGMGGGRTCLCASRSPQTPRP